MATFPTSSIIEIPPAGATSFPLLISITIADLVGPEAANRQPLEVDTRTLTLQSTVNQLVNNMNIIDTLFVQVDGSTAMTGNLPMGSNKLTGLAGGSTNGDSVRYEQLTALASIYLALDGSNAPSTDIPWGSNKITALAAGTAAGDAVEYDQMNTAIDFAVAAAFPLTFERVEIAYEYNKINTSTIRLRQHAEVALRNWSAGEAVPGTPLAMTKRTTSGDLSKAWNSGDLSNDTWYYLFLLGNTSAPSYGEIHWQVTPDMTEGQLSPHGADVYRRIGSFRTSATGFVLAAHQSGRRVLYEDAYDLIAVVGAINVGLPLGNKSAASWVPPLARKMILTAYGRGRDDGFQYLYAGYTGADEGHTVGYAFSYETGGGSDVYGDFSNMFEIQTSPTQQIGLSVNSTWNVLGIFASGYVDEAI